jgi:hypothetical protein
MFKNREFRVRMVKSTKDAESDTIVVNGINPDEIITAVKGLITYTAQAAVVVIVTKGTVTLVQRALNDAIHYKLHHM